MTIIERKEQVKSYLDNETVCDILISLGIEANPRKNFKIRDEEHPSASIRHDGFIKDFGGDFAGDIIDFLKEKLKVSFYEAIEYLEGYFNISDKTLEHR